MKIAILDFYNQVPNEGIKCLENILQTKDIFDVRQQLPDLSYDLFVLSSGVGSPSPQGEAWERLLVDWLESIKSYNQNHTQKKWVLAISHSFLFLAETLHLGKVEKRKTTSFGLFPIHVLCQNDLFKEPEFVSFDLRDYQMTTETFEPTTTWPAAIWALEKERPHVQLPRAIMALAFTPEIIGVQFHPEADAQTLMRYLNTHREDLMQLHGEAKFAEMTDILKSDSGVLVPHFEILTRFISLAHAQQAIVS